MSMVVPLLRRNSVKEGLEAVREVFVTVLQQSLDEELAKVVFCDAILPTAVRKYLNLRASGAQADH